MRDIDYDPSRDFDEDIQNPLMLQNKLIEPESGDLDSINRNIVLANFNDWDLQTVRLRASYRVHLASLLETHPEYNVKDRLTQYIKNHIDFRNNFDSSSSVGNKALGRKLLRTNISEHNIKQNEVKSPQISPIFPGKQRQNSYNDY